SFQRLEPHPPTRREFFRLAALGCTLLQISAIIFHATRGEFAALPLNFLLLALVAFILWGRSKRAPILPRM
ncbi:DoxX family protein, partial [Mesorhizobium tianshanense]|uniref:DoxX family protein n=1 Tax=Mesorhizobium tianshanense TaxID=39844 RepID=UPI0024E16669